MNPSRVAAHVRVRPGVRVRIELDKEKAGVVVVVAVLRAIRTRRRALCVISVIIGNPVCVLLCVQTRLVGCG